MDKGVEAAKAEARRTGRRVEIPSKFTEHAKVWASEDGTHLQTEISLSPIQTKNRRGGWDPIDTALVAKDGAWVPKTVRTPLKLSVGGTKTLVTADGEHGTVTTGLNGKLPRPTISGNTAVYRDAISPGVDLSVSALADGYVQRVVIRERPSGPVSVKLPFTLPAGMDFGAAPGGAPQLHGKDGKPAASPVHMIAEDALVEQSPELGHTGTVKAKVVRDDGRQALVVEPDAGFLASRDTAYPVTVSISSIWYGAGVPVDTLVSSVQYPAGAPAANWLRAGTSSNASEIWHSYLKFNISKELRYSTILNADLRMWNYQSHQCGLNVGAIYARRVTSDWSPATITWGGRPAATSTGQETNTAAYGTANCSPSSGLYGTGELYYSVEPIVRSWLSGSAPNYGFQLRAANEGTGPNWRQFRSAEYTGSDGIAPVLYIEYQLSERVRVAFTSDTQPASFPTYQQAVAMQEVLPATPEHTAITTAQLDALADQRYTRSDTSMDQLLPLEGETDAPPLDPDIGDGTLPIVTGTAPADGATGVHVGTAVTVTFSETVRGAVVTVTDPDGGVVAGAADEPEYGGTTLTFTPAEPLRTGVAYTATVGGGIDLWDNVMTPHSWSFTTSTTSDPPPTPTPTPTVDTTPPAVVATSPQANATGVPADTVVTVTFSEPVTGVRIAVANGQGASVAGTVATNGSTAAFTPSAPLTGGVTYTVTVSAAADAAGNVQTPHTWTFTTVPAAAQPVNPNPYFETEIDPWYSYYLEDELTRSTTRAHEGIASARFVPLEGTWGAAAEEVEVSPGTAYHLSGWFYPVATSVEGFEFGIEWYDESYDYLGYAPFAIQQNLGVWQRVSAAVSAPTTAVHAVIYVSGAATIHFDEVTLVPAAGLAATRAGAGTNKTRAHGPSSLRSPDGRGRAKPTARTARSAAAAASGFDYKHITLEQCTAARRNGGTPYASFGWSVVNRYSSCWSKFIGVGEYVKQGDNYRPQVEDGYVVEATTVYHTYLGTADGSAVVDGSGVTPQTVSLFTRLGNIVAYDDDDVIPAADLDDYRIGLVISSDGESGSTCRLTPATLAEMRAKGWQQYAENIWTFRDTIAKFKADGDDTFRFVSDSLDGDRVNTCTMRPRLYNTLNEWDEFGDEVDDETWDEAAIPLWNTGCFDDLGLDAGKVVGTARVCGGSRHYFAPTVRCDELTFGKLDSTDSASGGRVAAASDSTYGVHTGACVFREATPVFEMSKSKAAAAGKPMDQVIDHIATALDPLRNKDTWPYLLDAAGNRQKKTIPGNADKPRGTVEGLPLKRTTDKAWRDENRKVFSWERRIDGILTKGECDRYYWEMNPQHRGTQHYTDAGLECDEFPFASTQQGAWKAAGHYSVRPVLALHNNKHGLYWLRIFYSRNRVGNNNEFLVRTMS
ncbi:hypothetical protein DQ384_00070 [Sphaerisporangium album]|uniref:DNRLRE domain-containing protein n=1 Tax=Sphaerisporangium album TaxID=509200 RepID=A0A367FRK2_9ACTN|nr:hypothetical protein DQ384_00070 [Sphaerisporangium album]